MIFLSLILMEIILYMVIHHFFINYFIQLALIHYPPHACTCHEWRGKRSKGDLCSDRADLLLQMAKSCLILPPAIKISKSFAIFLMSLIFHSLISFIFLLRLLNTNFANLGLSKYINDVYMQGSIQDFGGLVHKSSL